MTAGFKGMCLELKEHGANWFSIGFENPERVVLNDEKVEVVAGGITWKGSAKKRYEKSVRFKVKNENEPAANATERPKRPWGPGDLITVTITITTTTGTETLQGNGVVDPPNLEQNPEENP